MLNYFLPIIFVSILIGFYLEKRFGIKKLQECKSRHFKKIIVWQKHNGERLLTTDNFSQGISIDNPDISKSYWYKQAELCENYCKNKKNPSILFLGLGAGTGPQLINKKNPKIKQTIIEFDKKIIEICKKFFNLGNLKNTTIINADAYSIIAEKKYLQNKFDVIAIDIFTGKESFGPSGIKINFIKKLTYLLKPDGALIFNRLAHRKDLQEETKLLEAFLFTIFEVTEKTFIKDPRGYKNELVEAYKIRKKKK
jgi:spermidine synthase